MSDLVKEYGVFKEGGGVFELNLGVLKVGGPDAADYLHRMTTQNVKGLVSGTGLPSAILQSNGMLIAPFMVYNTGNFFLIVAETESVKAIASHLEKFHFAEDFEMQDISGEFKVLSVQGVGAGPVLQECGYKPPKGLHEITGAEECFVINEPDFGIKGFHLIVKAGCLESVKRKLENKGFHLLNPELWNLLRSEAGFFAFGVDVTEKNIIIEAAMAEHVSRDKGCYPGQEVVERIFTYGNVAKKLVGLELMSGGADPGTLKIPAKLYAEGKETGQLTSLKHFPWNNKYFGFGVVRKPFYEPGQTLQLENGAAILKVVLLPGTFDIHRKAGRDQSSSTVNS